MRTVPHTASCMASMLQYIVPHISIHNRHSITPNKLHRNQYHVLHLYNSSIQPGVLHITNRIADSDVVLHLAFFSCHTLFCSFGRAKPSTTHRVGRGNKQMQSMSQRACETPYPHVACEYYRRGLDSCCGSHLALYSHSILYCLTYRIRVGYCVLYRKIHYTLLLGIVTAYYTAKRITYCL